MIEQTVYLNLRCPNSMAILKKKMVFPVGVTEITDSRIDMKVERTKWDNDQEEVVVFATADYHGPYHVSDFIGDLVKSGWKKEF